jgi:hypothetical protein
MIFKMIYLAQLVQLCSFFEWVEIYAKVEKKIRIALIAYGMGDNRVNLFN